ncbi:MAG: helix-turn-helix transcriptional regulator [Lachnospiraceae bacterium]|nr:helix-turn-helix transcriptional regulator [Lachnospiraceae bacterium]
MDYQCFEENVNHGTKTFPLATYKWNGDFNYTVNMHWHKETEIIFFEKGDFVLELEGEDIPVKAPCFALIEGKLLHGLTLAKNQIESAIVFDGRMLNYEMYDEAQRLILDPILNRKKPKVTMIPADSEGFSDLKKAYKKAMTEADKKSRTSFLTTKLYITEFLSIMYENGFITAEDTESETGENSMGLAENVQLAMTYVRDHFDSKIKVKDISDYLGLNEQYLCRCFKKMTGKTLTEYINEVRVERASKMLKDTDERIIDIAMATGYDNISYFIKRFKVIKGVTPQEYRVMK